MLHFDPNPISSGIWLQRYEQFFKFKNNVKHKNLSPLSAWTQNQYFRHLTHSPWSCHIWSRQAGRRPLTIQTFYIDSLIAFDERVTVWLQRVRSLPCACAYVALFARRPSYNHYAIAHPYSAANAHAQGSDQARWSQKVTLSSKAIGV